MMMDNSLSEEILVARALLYRFLALAFHEPGEPLIALLANQEQLGALEAAAGAVDQFAESDAISPALNDLLRVTPPPGWPVRELRVEYTRLFIGPGRMPCPPYESVYDRQRPEPDRGTVFGPSARKMEEVLSDEGLVVDLGRAELADHVAIELEFMYYLLSRAVGGDAGPDAGYLYRSDEFLQQRLAGWLPRFGERVLKSTSHPFYRRLGSLLAALIRLEAELFLQDCERDALPA